MQLVSYVAGAARRLSPVEISLGCAWLVALTVLEFVGRRFTSDVADGAALFGLALLVCMTAAVHKIRNLQTVAAIGKCLLFLLRTFRQSTIEVGVDLTRSPPLPRGIPSKACWLLALLSVLVPCLMIVAPELPSAARAALAAHFYLACLVLTAIIWFALAFGIILHTALTWARLHDWLVERHRDQRPRSIRTELHATLFIYSLVLASAVIMPVWVPFAIHAGYLIIACGALLASRPGLDLLWRCRWGSPIRVIDARWLYWTACSGSALFTMAMCLISSGDSFWGSALFPRLGAAPVTSLLGRVFTWMSVGGNFVAVYSLMRYAALGSKFHPRQSSPGRGPAETATDRRSEIRHRREIIRRLKILIRRAARQTGPRGTGLWIGLQHWFILGLSRDSDQSDGFDRETTILDEIIGPPYHQIFTSAAREHFRQVTAALKVDLIFVENGVGIRRLVRVLRVMFEIYDVYGGRQRAEERHFTGLAGVRVLFHDFDMCTAAEHGRDKYPEPDYEQVGRARILHVFKDRGGPFDDAPVPESWEGVPVASGV